MKYLFLFFLFFSGLSCAQQYESVFFEKGRIDANNQVYSHGRTFFYAVDIEQDESPLFLVNENRNYTLLPYKPDSLQTDEIHFIIASPRLFRRTNSRQTEIFYGFNGSELLSISQTGLVENDSNVWMHPIRSGFFASLETCPFPYYKLNYPMEVSWEDSMSIGNYWSDSTWGAWDSERLKINYTYRVSGDSILTTDLGAIPCVVIEAIGSSEIGVTKLRSYYSDQFGFVRLDYVLSTGIKVSLQLKKVVQNPEVKNFKAYIKKDIINSDVQ